MTGDLAPGFLVASPSLSCPFFHHTLLLMVDHGAEGSFGFVLNKIAGIGLDAITDEMKVRPDADRSVELPVLLGGPVAPNTGWVLFDPSDGSLPADDMLSLGEGMAITASTSVLRRCLEGSGPGRAMLLLGYSGWSPGQLEAEMKEGAWIPVDVDSALVFETPLDERWDMAFRVLGVDPARVVGGASSAASA